MDKIEEVPIEDKKKGIKAQVKTNFANFMDKMESKSVKKKFDANIETRMKSNFPSFNDDNSHSVEMDKNEILEKQPKSGHGFLTPHLEDQRTPRWKNNESLLSKDVSLEEMIIQNNSNGRVFKESFNSKGLNKMLKK